MRFSQRIGRTEVRSVIQHEAIDEPLMHKLWDVISMLLPSGALTGSSPFARIVWADFFERPLDSLPYYSNRFIDEVREWFYGAEWFEVYDLVEFAARYRDALVAIINPILERYLAAYRIVGGEIVPVSDDQSVAAIEAAIDHPLRGVRAHISKALSLLANRQNPDPENSIKESISAIESLCSSIVGSKATLGQALKRLRDAGIDIHPALQTGWGAIYGWTSDQDGIRHAMQDDPNLSVEDALYFVVSASAFVSLLTEKASRAGIDLVAVS